MAALWLSACTSDETLENITENSPVEFGTYVGKDAQTRGAVADLDKLKSMYDFAVFAYYTGQNNYSATSTPNFMHNQLVRWGADQWDNRLWVYSPVKYWPNNEGDKISFFAYAPYSNGGYYKTYITPSSNTAAGDPKITFQVKDNVGGGPGTEQIDLLYADPVLDKTKPGISEKVTFNFKHALTRIGFKAEVKIDVANTDGTGEVDNASVQGGNIEYLTNFSISKVELIGKFYKSGTLNLNGGSWTPAAATEEVIYTLSETGNNLQNHTNIVINKTNLINNDNSYMMLIPKNFTGTDQIKIRVTYKVRTSDSNLNGGASEITNVVTSDPFNFNFEQGKAYNFVIHLGMTTAKFDAQIADWKDATDYVSNN